MSMVEEKTSKILYENLQNCCKKWNSWVNFALPNKALLFGIARMLTGRQRRQCTNQHRCVKKVR